MRKSVNEIAKELGLEPPVAYRQSRRFTPGWPHESGRTTAILLQALSDMSVGHKVKIVGHDLPYSRHLTRRVTGWAETLGLDPSLVAPAYHPARPGTKMHFDHYRGKG